MSVQEFYDAASDLSLKALVIDGVADAIVNKSREAMLHSMLLGNLASEIRKGVISKDPKTPQQILTFALLEEKACRSVNSFYTLHEQPTLALYSQNFHQNVTSVATCPPKTTKVEKK